MGARKYLHCFCRRALTTHELTTLSARVFLQLAMKEMKAALKAKEDAEKDDVVEKPMTQMGGIFYMMYQVSFC